MSYRNYEGRMRHYTASFDGILAHLQRRYAETESELVRAEDRGVHERPRLPGVPRRPPASRRASR